MSYRCEECGRDSCPQSGVGHPTKTSTNCWFFHPPGTLIIKDSEDMGSKTTCIRCGKSSLVDQFVNTGEYDAFECLKCKVAWRVMQDGEIQIILGYNGPRLDDFILVKGVLIIRDSEPIE